ncbi:MAG: hypothetical protein Q9162_002351 [Coniocarpon cinnabarinum]
MALVHDFGESIIGDITPYDGVSKEDKNFRESLAFDYLAGLAGPNLGRKMKSLWQEFEEGTTREARLVRGLDRLECVA